MDEFFRTVMGRRFFEDTMPGIRRELTRLNENLEALRALIEKNAGGPLAAGEKEARDEGQDA